MQTEAIPYHKQNTIALAGEELDESYSYDQINILLEDSKLRLKNLLTDQGKIELQKIYNIHQNLVSETGLTGTPIDFDTLLNNPNLVRKNVSKSQLKKAIESVIEYTIRASGNSNGVEQMPMSEDDLETIENYQKAKKAGIPQSVALQLARFNVHKLNLPK